MSDHSLRASEALTSGSNAQGCAPHGSARTTATASGFSPDTGPECRATATSESCAEPTSSRSMFSAEGFPVRTSARPAGAEDSPAPARVFGESTPGSWASFDRDTSSWRTFRYSGPAGSLKSSKTSMRAGMTRSGTAYPLQPLAPRTAEIASGSLPTPAASNYGMAKHALWPTPRASPNENRQLNLTPSQIAGTHGRSLAAEVNRVERAKLFPTPTARDYKDGPYPAANARKSPGLGTVAHWPTPRKSMAHGSERLPIDPEQRKADGRQVNLTDQVGGQLNPTWVEWLMGFPIGWTDLEPSETRSSRRSRSGSGDGS
jgi:hypothetical protein